MENHPPHNCIHIFRKRIFKTFCNFDFTFFVMASVEGHPRNKHIALLYFSDVMVTTEIQLVIMMEGHLETQNTIYIF